ncbi:MAG: HAMP domain-containing histidine kinase [Proteobacteria bacterium]|nr:HAMP domain-containing histidine kinase [Pseudomonadota bacterium]
MLLLPLVGIGILRLYESALLRQTEAELLAQAAVLSAAYRSAWLEQAPAGALRMMPMVEAPWNNSLSGKADGRWLTLVPKLDLAEIRILPPAPDAVFGQRPPEPVSERIARSLSAIVEGAQKMTLAAIRIVDAAGVIVSSTAKTDVGFSLGGQEEVAYALKGAPTTVVRQRIRHHPDVGWESISRNSDLRVFVALPVLAEGHVLGAILVSRTPRDIIQTLYGKRWVLVKTVLVLMATVAALAWFTGLAVVRPTRQLADMAQRVARGEIRAVQPIRSPMTREACSLSESIVSIAQTLEARADYARDLALGISHEFKTPLTSIRGSAELLQDHFDEMSNEERCRFLSNILGDTVRLERLVRRILDLARADALMPQGRENCDLAVALAEIAEDSCRKGRSVVMKDLPSSMPAAIDRTSFDIILSNLLENAHQHGGPGVSVVLSGFADPRQVTVDVADNGPGIPPDNADRIFDRFFTTGRDSGKTGLGLAIARRYARAYGGDVILCPSERGAVFRIRLSACR